MTIDEWCNDTELVGEYFKFPDGMPVTMVFLSDGEVRADDKGNKQVEFQVEVNGTEYKMSSGSKRLLSKLKEVANFNKHTLVGKALEITRKGEAFDTKYEVKEVSGK